MPVFGAFLLVSSAIWGLPAIVVLIMARHRINRTIGQVALAASFACASAYWNWRVEWFDGWRLGTPPASQLLVYTSYTAACAGVGWWLAGRIVRPRALAR